VTPEMRLPRLDHEPTSEELRLRVVAQTNGENAALGQRALHRLAHMDAERLKRLRQTGQER
jgi:hypothetical protein